VRTRSTRSLAWLLWVLTLLGLAATGWLDRLLRLAGRPALTWSQEGSLSPGPSRSFLASSAKVGVSRANGVLPKVQRASRPEDPCRRPAWPSTARAVR
jgi:hypothetical protein